MLKNWPSDQSTASEASYEIVIRANYELFVLTLSALQVTNSFLILLLRNANADRIPIIVNSGLAIFFLLDASYRLWKSPDRRRFFFQYHGYLTILGSLPFPFSGIFRLIWYRVVTIRLRRSDFVKMEQVVVYKRAQSVLLVGFLAAIVILEASSIAIIEMESNSANANILTANDAIWWALVTMATVGYGDFYPVTTGGRFVAFFVMVVGVGIFSVMTSYLSHAFLRPRREKDELVHLGIQPSPGDAHGSIEALKALLDQQEASHTESMAEIREKLDSLEEELMRTRGE